MLQRLARGGRRAWLSTLLCLLPVSAAMAAPPAERASLEAAIVYNVLLFVQWPGEDAVAAGAPFVLCLDGTSPLYPVTRQLTGRPLRRMKLNVQSVADAAGRCQAIYVDSEASQKAATVLVGNAVLVIAGSQYSPSEAPTVQLFQHQDRLAFDISQSRAKQAGLQISSKLLRLARKVVE